MAAKKRKTAGGKPAAGKKKEDCLLNNTPSGGKKQGNKKKPRDFVDAEFEVVEDSSQVDDQAMAEAVQSVNEQTTEWSGFKGTEEEAEAYKKAAAGDGGRKVPAEQSNSEWDKSREELEAGIKEQKAAEQASGEAEAASDDFIEKVRKTLLPLSVDEYEQARLELAKKTFKVRTAWLDKVFSDLQPDNAGQSLGAGVPIVFEEPEPWTEPVDGAALLTEISSTIKRFLILPDEGADIMALYAVFTYIFKAFGICPLLIFLSAIMRSGKTLAETIMSFLCNKSIAVSNISEAVLYRVVTRDEPTLIMDELDALFGQKKSDKSEATRALLNSGQTIFTAFVLRCNPQTFEPEMFSTYCPKICAAIKTLPATIMDRGFVLHLERKKPSEKVERFSKVKVDPAFGILRSKVQRWVNDNREQLKTIEPALPPGLSDREVDNLEPLFAVAQAAGPEWITRASKSALFLSAKSAEEGEAAIMLLEDIYNYFSKHEKDRVSSKDLADYLGELEVRPWPEWRKDKPISPRQIASILKPFNISPSPIRIDGLPTKGYDKKNFVDAWGRYLNGYAVTEDDNSIQNKDLKRNRKVTVTDTIGYEKESVTDPKSYGYTTVTPGEQVNSIRDKDIENQEKKCNRVTDKNGVPGGAKI